MAFFASEAAKPPHHLGHMRPGIGILHRGKLRCRVVRPARVHRPVGIVRGQNVVRDRSAQASVAVVGEVPPGGSTHVSAAMSPLYP